MAEDINSFISKKAKEYGVDEDFVYSVIKHESGGNPKANSPVGARGLMQLMPETARSLGVKNIDDPYENIEGGIKYLSQLQKAYKDPSLIAAAYNAGPGAVAKYKGIPPYKETQNYARNVSNSYKIAKAKRGDTRRDASPYDPFSLPAYGDDTEPSASATPKKEIKTIKKRGLDKFEEEVAPENNFNYEPQWSRRQKAGRAIDEEFSDLYNELSPEGKKKFDAQVKEPFIKKYEEAVPLSEDIMRGVRVGAQSTVRALPQAAEDFQNTARFLTGGNKSIVPKADYTKNILPGLASEEERAKRIPEQIIGGAPAYAVGGAALKTIGAIPQVASIVSKIPAVARTAAAIAAPVVPIEGTIKNIVQGVAGGAQSAVSQAVKQNANPNIEDVGKAAGGSGALTAATILAGKVLGKGVSTIAGKAVESKLKPGLADDTGTIAKDAVERFRNPEATETVTGRVIPPSEAKPVQSLDAYKLDPEVIAKEEQGIQSREFDRPFQEKPSISESEYFGARKVPEEGNVGELGYSPKPQALKARIESENKIAPDELGAQSKLPETKSKVEDVSDVQKMIEVNTPVGKAPVSQAKINTKADQLLDTPSSAGPTYKQILTDDVNYGPEYQKQMHDELLNKAKTQAAQERSNLRNEYNWDSQPAANKRYIDEGINELEQLEYRQHSITAKGEEPSNILRDKITLTKQELETSAKTGKPGRPPKEIWLRERWGGVSENRTPSNVSDEALRKFKPQEGTPVINKKSLGKKLGIDLITKESGTAEPEFTGAPQIIKGVNSVFKAVNKFAKNPQASIKAIYHEPLRTFERNKMPELADAVRKMTAHVGSYFMQVEHPLLSALADIKIEETSYPKIKDALNQIRTDELVSGNVTDNPIWNSLTPEEKAWTHIVARFFKESGDYLGFNKEDYIPNYFPRMKGVDPTLVKLVTKSKSSPGFMHERTAPDEVIEFSNNIPQVVMRYANGVRRQALLGVVGDGVTVPGEDALMDSAFRTAYKKAKEEGNQEVLNAISQVRENLLDVSGKNLTDDIINQGMRNFVENTLRQSVSAGLLNLTQTPTLLLSEVGPKIYMDAVWSLFEQNPVILNAIKGNIDLNQYSGAKYDFQRSISEGALDVNTSLQKYKEATQERILIDSFGSVEKYLNQPLAIISGMIKRAGGKKQLIDSLNNINRDLQSSDAGIRQAAMDARNALIGEGMKINQRTNFVRMQADRPNYESAQLSKLMLPLLNYSIKEAGWNADKWYELAVNPPGSEGRLNALRALSTYAFFKSLVMGPKAAAGLYIPAWVRSLARDAAPEEYAMFEDKLQDIDDKVNLPGKAGLDYSDAGGLLDLTNPSNLNSPVFQQIKKTFTAGEKILDKDTEVIDKVKAAGEIGKMFIPTPTFKGKKYEAPLGIGQASEFIRGGINAIKGTRKTGRQEHKTDLGEEAKAVIGPLKETQSVYKEKQNRKDAVELTRRGVRPSRTQIREITRAKYGDEGVEKESNRDERLDSVRTGAIKKSKKLFDRELKGGKDTSKYEEELRNEGLKKSDINKHVRKIKANERKANRPATIRKRHRRVEALKR